MSEIKVLLVDDQVLFVESLKNILEMRADDITVTGIAHNGQEALDSVERDLPDIVLMDVRMPVLNGIDASKEIYRRHPEIAIMMLTTLDDAATISESIRLGVRGYILKDIPPAELIVSIRAIKGGIFQISPAVAHKLVQNSLSLAMPSFQPGREPQWLAALSYRELEILKLLIAGFSNKEIAGRLGIVEQTVKNHLSVIYDKLNVHDRVHLLKAVMDAGIQL